MPDDANERQLPELRVDLDGNPVYNLLGDCWEAMRLAALADLDRRHAESVWLGTCLDGEPFDGDPADQWDDYVERALEIEETFVQRRTKE